jgi:hypothetical protein
VFTVGTRSYWLLACEDIDITIGERACWTKSWCNDTLGLCKSTCLSCGLLETVNNHIANVSTARADAVETSSLMQGALDTCTIYRYVMCTPQRDDLRVAVCDIS